MEKYRQTIGQLGENKARNYLKRRGYQILESNYRTKAGEIDLIAKDRDCLVFVEVKTRTSEEFGSPAEAVNYYKQQHMINSAKYYLARHGGDCECRFDVIEVYLPAGNRIQIARINHLKNVLQ